MLNMSFQFFAHKKGGGSTKNGRDSESKRLGAKRAGGQFLLAGNILLRQRSPLRSTARSSSSVWARIARCALSTQNSNLL